MSLYSMIRKGIEFDAALNFRLAAEAKHFTNTTGLIDVMDHCVAKFDHVTSGEGDEEEVAEERLALVAYLADGARSCVVDGDRRALKRIDDAESHHVRTSAPGNERFRRASDRRFP